MREYVYVCMPITYMRMFTCMHVYIHHISASWYKYELESFDTRFTQSHGPKVGSAPWDDESMGGFNGTIIKSLLDCPISTLGSFSVNQNNHFTNLNSSAIKGDDFPKKTNHSQGSQ